MAPRLRDGSTRVKTLLDAATTLHAQLLDSAAITTDSNGSSTNAAHHIDVKALDRHIELALSACSLALDAEDRMRLDASGTKLWNTCTRLLRNQDGDKEPSHVRVFAFFMLECGTRTGGREDDADRIRLLKVALKTSKTCIALDQLDLALKVLETAATREEALPKAGNGDQTSLIRRLSSEYYLLRIYLAWHQDKLALCEHMFSKIPLPCLHEYPDVAARLAEVLYEIGSTLLRRNESSCAENWLARASESLVQPVLEQVGQDTRELRFCVLHALARAKLVQKAETDQDMLDLLSALQKRAGLGCNPIFPLMNQQEYDKELPVSLLTLDVICKQATPDTQWYYDCLCRVIEMVPMSEPNCKLLMAHLQNLWNLDASLALSALEKLLLERLASQEDAGLLERGIVTCIWMATSSPALNGGLEPLISMMARLNVDFGTRLGAEAAQASFILVWKRVSNAFEHKEYGIAADWCRFAQQSIFENAGEMNKAKLQRKILLCALESGDCRIAREAFPHIGEKCKADPLTRYLMYRIALRDDDLALAQECLEVLCSQGLESPTYLLGCVAEAQQSGMKRQIAIVLERLVESLEGKPCNGVNLPALLRCTIRLLIAELGSENSATSSIVEQICKKFEYFEAPASQDRLTTGYVELHELEWFSRNSYNLAVQHCATWESPYILRLLNSCIKTVDLYPPDIGSDARFDITSRKLFCEFLGAIISVAQARLHENQEPQRDYYLAARSHIQGFRMDVQAQLSSSDEALQEELREKYRTLLAFDFEASVRLQEWNSLIEIVEESRAMGDERLYGIFADAILCSGAPIDEISQVFQMILRIVREQATDNTRKISHWLRCLFQLSSESDIRVAEDVLEHAFSLARDRPRKKGHPEDSSAYYPEEELEWLATSAFNRAIDFYLASDDMTSQRWCGRALDIAQLVGDNGALYSVLQEKYACLTWDN